MLTPLLRALKNANQEKFNRARAVRAWFIRIERALKEFGNEQDAMEIEAKLAPLVDKDEFLSWVQYYEVELFKRYQKRSKQ